MLRVTSNITSRFSDKMSASVPVEMGTRGTVGSLLKKEIEYFKRLELDCKRSCNNKYQKSTVEIDAGGGGSSWPSLLS
ncbi:hypothetical protein A4A49_65672 [Nicotiana attenuata]|uniref:Uncharacterized protein n=1 Tax=Nicotiana attenuata TaxID=49451 RepID=A0A1J6JTZ5_NICAT|nr:hypothetical protein A4A49_65672 [Nicotiana attenuata]